MTITASLVLFAVFWFLILFIILPLNIKTQQEEGKRSYGTPTSAPINANIKKKMILVTLLSSIIWLISMVLMKALIYQDLSLHNFQHICSLQQIHF